MSQQNPEVPTADPGAAVSRKALQDVIDKVEYLLTHAKVSTPLPAELVATLAETKRQALEALAQIGVRGGKTRRGKHSKGKKHRKTRRH